MANYGTIHVSGAIKLSLIYENTGSIVATTLQVSTGLDTHGTITCSDSLITGLPGLGVAAISHVFGGALIETNVFYNPEAYRVLGSGTICISGESINGRHASHLRHLPNNNRMALLGCEYRNCRKLSDRLPARPVLCWCR